MSIGFDAPHGFGDAILACLDYLVGIVLVPSMILLRLSVGYCNV